MLHHVIVSFGDKKEYEYKVTAADIAGITAEDARKWLEREFEALECDLPNPIGKVLLADRVLSVAKYAGERRFKEHAPWAEQFARNAAVALGREVIRVDVANDTVGVLNARPPGPRRQPFAAHRNQAVAHVELAAAGGERADPRGHTSLSAPN
jgi:hypothetical protein